MFGTFCELEVAFHRWSVLRLL